MSSEPVWVRPDVVEAIHRRQLAEHGGAEGVRDAVAPAHKDAARANLAASIASVASLRAADQCLAELEQSTPTPPMRLVAMIEDPAALQAAHKIARQSRVMVLIVGSEDLATALGGVPEPDVLRLPKQLVHYAAKAAGLLSFGLFRTVADFSDLPAIQAAAREARNHGFDGATCVHPSSVPILNAAFGPSQQDIAWARDVVAQAESAGTGAFRLGDKMVDAPVLKRARNIMAQSD